MKTIWNVIAVMSFANLLAIGGITGWLLNSGRLDQDRLESVRELFAETIAEQAAREAAEGEAARADAEAADLAGRLDAPLITASEAVAVRLEASELDHARAERIRRDIEARKEALARDRVALERAIADFEATKDTFEQTREQIAMQEGDEQFRKSLSVVEGMKAEDAAAMITQLEAQGRRDSVLMYVDAMQERQRTKLMTELVEQDPVLAATLLEQLRARGVEVATP